MNKRHIGWILILVVIGFVVYWTAVRRPILTPTGADTSIRSVDKDNTTKTPVALSEPPGVGSPPSPADADLALLTSELNSTKTKVHDDLRLIENVLLAYQSTTHGPNPVGENAEITSVLTGKNKLGYQFIPKNHPAIRNGELCDRWGTPYFFHQISGSLMEIRSAGPDRQMWTNDDDFYNPEPGS